MTQGRQKILVVGGAGFVGSHACKALHQAGYQPVVFDNLSRGHASAVKWGPLLVGDLQDSAALDAAFAGVEPAAVMHFAAFAYVGESMQDPALYYRNNVTGTLNLLEAMRRARCKNIVFSSTCAVYGGIHDVPIDESTPCVPVSSYGHSKLICEQLLRDYARAYGLSAIALRYFNAAGSDPDGDIGEDHEPEPHIIPTILRVAAGRSPHVTINGDDHPTVDGTCVRDFVHVSDLASAHVLAVARALLAERSLQVFNLGLGRGYSLMQIVEAARRVTGHAVPVKFAGRREGDPPFAVGSAARARDLLGWAPRFTELDEMLEHAWCWQQRIVRIAA